jgi:hypothetical protein
MNSNSLLPWALTLLSFAWPIRGAQAPPSALDSPALLPFEQVDLARLEPLWRELTLRVIEQLRDPGFRAFLASRLGPGQTRASLNQLVRDWAETRPEPGHAKFSALLDGLDRDLRREMGLDQTAQAILGLDLVWPPEGPRRIDWSKALFAVRPQAPAPAWVEAYDLEGRMVRLDPETRPGVPVVMVGTDRREAVRAGVEAVNLGLAGAGFNSQHQGADPASPMLCAKLTAIRLAEDQEAWWKDGLEVYALVSGIDPTQAKPNIKLVNLPYLAHDATTYFPNQVLLFWSDFRFGAANIQLWNHGDGTNYQKILAAVLKGVAAAMAAGGAPAFSWIPALADAIVEAMPASWWTDSDTWLDTFYTLERGPSYQDLMGSGQTARITLVPWVLQPQAGPRP